MKAGFSKGADYTQETETSALGSLAPQTFCTYTSRCLEALHIYALCSSIRNLVTIPKCSGLKDHFISLIVVWVRNSEKAPRGAVVYTASAEAGRAEGSTFDRATSLMSLVLWYTFFSLSPSPPGTSSSRASPHGLGFLRRHGLNVSYFFNGSWLPRGRKQKLSGRLSTMPRAGTTSLSCILLAEVVVGPIQIQEN